MDRHAGPFVTLIAHCRAVGEVAGEPGDIFVDLRGIDHEEILVGRVVIGDEVVDHAAIFIEHDRVLAFANRESCEVVGEQAVELIERAGAADEHLAHVRNVEDANLLADRLVLIDDRAVLDGHVPSGEGHHPGAEGEMGGFEWRMVKVGHRSREDCEGARGLSIGHRMGPAWGNWLVMYGFLIQIRLAERRVCLIRPAFDHPRKTPPRQISSYLIQAPDVSRIYWCIPTYSPNSS